MFLSYCFKNLVLSILEVQYSITLADSGLTFPRIRGRRSYADKGDGSMLRDTVGGTFFLRSSIFHSSVVALLQGASFHRHQDQECFY